MYVLLEGFLGKSDVARGERASAWRQTSESAAGRDNRSAHRTRQVRRDLEFCQSPSGRLPRVTLGGGMFFIPVSSHHTNMAHTRGSKVSRARKPICEGPENETVVTTYPAVGTSTGLFTGPCQCPPAKAVETDMPTVSLVVARDIYYNP